MTRVEDLACYKKPTTVPTPSQHLRHLLKLPLLAMTTPSSQVIHEETGLHIQVGLEGQDHNIEELTRLFDLLRPYSAEILLSRVEDLMNFVFHPSTVYFGVLSTVTKEPPPGTKSKSKAKSQTTPPTKKNKKQKGKAEAPSDVELVTVTRLVGFIYLTMDTRYATGVLDLAELDVGVVLFPTHRKKGHARRAMDFVLKHAFQHLKAHRVQAVLVDKDAPSRDRMIKLLTQQSFAYEGARRRALCSPVDRQWKDIEYLSILDTEYLVRHYHTPAPKSHWDELLSRHQSEREELLLWDEKQQSSRGGKFSSTKKKIRKVTSAETIVGAPSEDESAPDSVSCKASGLESDTRGHPPLGSPKIPRSPSPASTLSGSGWDMVSVASSSSSEESTFELETKGEGNTELIPGDPELMGVGGSL